MAFTELNLFAGTGAMSVGLRCAIPGLRTVGYVEWDTHAATALLARMEEKALDPAPVFCGDVYDFDAGPYRGAVDLVSASPPCQPYSVAGSRRGNVDERSHGEGRGPIIGMLNVIEAVQPGLVFFENVPPWVAKGYFQSVRRRLFDLGYQCEEPLFLRAADVGAPHRRERVFILAYRDGEREAGLSAGPGAEGKGTADVERGQQDVADTRHQPRSAEQRPEPREGSRRDTAPADDAGARQRGEGVENPDHGQRDESNRAIRAGWAAAGGAGERLADANREGCGELGRTSRCTERGAVAAAAAQDLADPEQPRPQGIGPEQPQRRRESVALRGTGPADALFPPGPDDADAWARILAIDPTLEPALCRVAHGVAARVDRLRCTGNGVVPLQAAVAFAFLLLGVRR